MKVIQGFLLGLIVLVPTTLCAQELVPDTHVTAKARVLEVVEASERTVAGTETVHPYQTIRVEVLDGPEKGKEVTLENDYVQLDVDDVFYLLHVSNSVDGREYYTVSEPYRLPALIGFTVLFLISVLVFGGVQGIRGLLALAGSFFFIFYMLFPGILNGYSPLLVSIGVSSFIIVLGSYITHGFNKTTTAAVIGMIATVICTGVLAHVAVDAAHLTGFESEEAVYLNFDTGGSIDFIGLLLGGIMIGLLGVLYDVAIGQAISVEELHRVGPHVQRRTIYTRAIRMGREHIGALVNTLAIAYVGASLPLLLLFYASTADPWVLINREVFAAEIIRTMVGSIGLVLAVPITTFIAVLLVVRRTTNVPEPFDPNRKSRELLAVEEHTHHHHHA